jgi:hypothetical protein
MKKVICFSLWGNEYRYIGGAFQNVELAKIFYPDWICRFYMGGDVEEDTVSKLSKNSNVEILKMEDKCNWTGMFWRFLAAADPTVDVMLSRDADSRLHQREKAAVDEWLSSDKQFHIMRDHQYHSVPILGGMWGCKKGMLSNLTQAIEKYEKGDFLGVDQNFLGEHVYPFVAGYSLVHDEFFERKPFPKESGERNDEHFVGQAYYGDGSILDQRTIFIQDYLKLELVK